MRLFDWLFPPKCAGCGELLPWEPAPGIAEALCEKCLRKWESETLELCEYCFRPVSVCACLPKYLKRSGCGGFYKLVYYRPQKSDWVQNRMIYSIKRKRLPRTSTFFAERMYPAVEKIFQNPKNAGCASSFVLTHVPRPRRSFLQYGTDQAGELCAALSAVTGIPRQTFLRRVPRVGKEQKKLSAAGRMQNAKRAFALSPEGERECAGKRILLLDDLVTTGASMAACAALLFGAGAKEVYCLAVASDETNRVRKD